MRRRQCVNVVSPYVLASRLANLGGRILTPWFDVLNATLLLQVQGTYLHDSGMQKVAWASE